jgi:6-pyruvoyltetrahydropterin/6-carboxytetrahydropterin synthase
MRIYRDFHFEAAHYLPSAPPGHPNARVHGHSFRARVWLEGEPHPDTGVIFHFDDLSAAIAETQEALDHRFLNDVAGLGVPTLERITAWIWDRLDNKVPGLARIELHRDSCHEGCIYDGPRGRNQVVE